MILLEVVGFFGETHKDGGNGGADRTEHNVGRAEANEEAQASNRPVCVLDPGVGIALPDLIAREGANQPRAHAAQEEHVVD